MYQNDSLFTLAGSDLYGLLALSFCLVALTLWGAWVICGRVHWMLAVPVATVIFVAFEWVSPQIYYTYYRTIIDGLPAQSVIGAQPTVSDIVRVLAFQGPTDLSHHGRALLGWALITLGVLRLLRGYSKT